MKTTTTTNNTQSANTFKGISKLFILLIIAGTMNAQTRSKSPYLFGVAVGSHISGNAHGTILDASVGLYNGRNVFSLGACMQKRTMQFSGARFNYMRILTGKENFSEKAPSYGYDDSKLQLFCYANMEYQHQAALCYNAVKQEETLTQNQSEYPSNANAIRLSTAEVSAGLGLNIKLSKQLVWSNYIGLGVYSHLNYTPGMYCEKTAPVLTLGTSFKLNYFTR